MRMTDALAGFASLWGARYSVLESYHRVLTKERLIPLRIAGSERKPCNGRGDHQIRDRLLHL